MNVNNCNLAGLVESDIKLSVKKDVCDFFLRVRRDRKDKDIYDLIQCSIYGKKAIEFVSKIKKGDCIYVFGSYRSKNIIINGNYEKNDFPHFHVENFEYCKKN